MDEIDILKKRIILLEAELSGIRAKKRSLIHSYLNANIKGYILCPCGSTLQTLQEIPAHLDHMIDDWYEAAEKWLNEKN